MGPRAAAAVLAAAVLLSHLPLLTARYVQDDHVAVETNDIVASGSAAAIWGAGYWDATRGGDRSLYRPLTVSSFALERALTGGARPAVSHAINLLLHAGVCWTLFLLAVAFGFDPRAALVAALVFAVHPAKSEAVANVVGRSELLAALFTLAAAWCALKAGSRAAAWAAGGCVFLACCSKETGFVALFVVILCATGASRALDVIGMVLPSVLAVLGAVILRTVALEAFFPTQIVPVLDNPLVREHGVRYAATAVSLIARYAALVVFPFRLSNDYSGASIPIEPSFAALRPALGVVLASGLAWIATRGRAALTFAAIAALPYLVVSNLIVPAGALFAERFSYLPIAGLCLLLPWAFGARWARLDRPAIGVVIVLGAAMFARSLDWKDDATIFAATARHNPKSPRAPFWLGRADDAIANWPEFAAAWHDKGLALAKSGDLSGAERALEEAVRLEPERAQPRVALGLVLHRLGRPEAAEREVRKSILYDPENALAFAELGHLRYETGRRAEAAEAYRRAVALGRTDLLPRLRGLD